MNTIPTSKFTATWHATRSMQYPRVIGGRTYPAYASVTGDTWIIDEDGDQTTVNPGDLVKD